MPASATPSITRTTRCATRSPLAAASIWSADAASCACTSTTSRSIWVRPAVALSSVSTRWRCGPARSRPPRRSTWSSPGVPSSRNLAARLLLSAAVLGVGGWLWSLHARAWDLGGRSPVLSYDAAQYAVAARELSEHGRLATTFALPIELLSHPQPPWPLSAVQPGLVVAEAAVDRVTPRALALAGRRISL